jgi:hypothetical protein
MTGAAQLISRSCTTGWADWIHGELWLLPTALVRRRLDLPTTRANGPLGPTVTDPLIQMPEYTFDTSQLLTAHRTNKVITFAEIDSVRMTRRRTVHGLKIVMKNGQRHRLMWLSRDPASARLADVLPR